MERKYCVNAIHRIQGETKKPLSPDSKLWCEECLKKKKPIPFDPNALRS